MLEKFEEVFDALEDSDEIVKAAALRYVLDVLTEYIPSALEENRYDFEKSTVLYVCFNSTDIGLSIMYAKADNYGNVVNYLENLDAISTYSAFCKEKGYKKFSNYYIKYALNSISKEAIKSKHIGEVTANEDELSITICNPVYRICKD